MSRKTVAFRRKVSQTNGTAEAIEKLIPRAAVRGEGVYLNHFDPAKRQWHDRPIHGTRANSRPCTIPMDGMKAMRLRAGVLRGSK